MSQVERANGLSGLIYRSNEHGVHISWVYLGERRATARALNLHVVKLTTQPMIAWRLFISTNPNAHMGAKCARDTASSKPFMTETLSVFDRLNVVRAQLHRPVYVHFLLGYRSLLPSAGRYDGMQAGRLICSVPEGRMTKLSTSSTSKGHRYRGAIDSRSDGFNNDIED